MPGSWNLWDLIAKHFNPGIFEEKSVGIGTFAVIGIWYLEHAVTAQRISPASREAPIENYLGVA